MRTSSVWILCALLVCGCGTGDDERAAGDGLQLPRAVVMGARPLGQYVEIEIRRDGTTLVDGRMTDDDTIHKDLRHAARLDRPRQEVREESEVVHEEPVLEDEPFVEPEDVEPALDEAVDAAPGPAPRFRGRGFGHEPDGSAMADVLLRVDRRTTWNDVVRVLTACANPSVKLYRIFFALEDDEGEEGALALFLPKDRSGPCARSRPTPS